MRPILIIAGKEFRDGLRNRWVLGATATLALFALSLAFLGSAPVGEVRVEALTVTVVSLASLSIFLLPLLALLLAFDAIVGEAERGTLALLLAYPLSRGELLLGKFAGHSAILGLATALGYGSAGLAVWLGATEGGGEGAFALLLLSSFALGAAFLAIGYVISAAAKERAGAAGLAVGVWLFFVLVYDLGLLGVLVADHGRWLGPTVVNLLLLLDPADVYRMLNLGTSADVRLLSGMAGLARDLVLSPWVLAGALLFWVAGPLAAALTLFRRRPA